MEYIFDRSGNVIKRSRNLRGIREYLKDHWVLNVLITSDPDSGRGNLHITFRDGSYNSSSWASFAVLCYSLRNWRNLYGASLSVDNIECGNVEYSNATLIKHGTW